MPVTPVTEPEPKAKSFPQPLGLDWVSIRADYDTGLYTYVQLANKHGIPLGALKMHAKRNHWSKPVELKLKRTIQTALSQTIASFVPDLLREQQAQWKVTEQELAKSLANDVSNRPMNVPARDLASYASVADTASRIARRALDMDVDSNLVAFGQGMMTGITAAQRAETPSEKPADAIEVEAVHESPPSST